MSPPRRNRRRATSLLAALLSLLTALSQSLFASPFLPVAGAVPSSLSPTSSSLTADVVIEEEGSRSLAEAKSYSLFAVPAFSMTLTVDVPPPSSPSAYAPLTEEGVRRRLESVTTSYLRDHFDSTLTNNGSEEKDATGNRVAIYYDLHSLELDATVTIEGDVAGDDRKQRNLLRAGSPALSSETTIVRAEFAGQLVLQDSSWVDPRTKPIKEDVSTAIEGVLNDAFHGSEQEGKYLHLLQTSSDSYQNDGGDALSATVKVEVKSPMDLRNEREKLRSDLQRQSDLQEQEETEKFLSMKKKEGIVVFVMGWSLFVLVGCLYVYASKEHKRYAEGIDDKYTEGMSSPTGSAGTTETFRIDDDIDDDDEDETIEFQGRSSSSSCGNAGEEATASMRSLGLRSVSEGCPDKDNLVAVPAREQHFRSASDGPVSLSYVQPASPFDVLYGAAFLHSDMEQVERHYGGSGSGVDRSGRRRRRKKRRGTEGNGRSPAHTTPSSKIRPMLSIAEEEISSPPYSPAGAGEADVVYGLDDRPHPRSTANGGANGGGGGGMGVSLAISNFVSSFFDADKTETLSGSSHAIMPDGAYDPRESSGAEEGGFAFKDFPRTDGTPCLIYHGSRHDGGEAEEEEGALSDSRHDGNTMQEGESIAYRQIVVGGERGVQSDGGGEGGAPDVPNLDILGSSYVQTAAVNPPRYRSASSSSSSRPIPDGSQHSASSAHSNASSLLTNGGANVNNFVDRLERLMKARSVQYEERVQRDKEREARKRERLEARRKERRNGGSGTGTTTTPAPALAAAAASDGTASSSAEGAGRVSPPGVPLSSANPVDDGGGSDEGEAAAPPAPPSLTDGSGDVPSLDVATTTSAAAPSLAVAISKDDDDDGGDKNGQFTIGGDDDDDNDNEERERNDGGIFA